MMRRPSAARRPATGRAGRIRRRTRKFARGSRARRPRRRRSSPRTAAPRGRSCPPPRRNAKKRSIAGEDPLNRARRGLVIASMIAMIAPAAGTISAMIFSIASWIRMPGIAAFSPSHTMRPDLGEADAAASQKVEDRQRQTEDLLDLRVEPLLDRALQRAPQVVTDPVGGGRAEVAQPLHRVGGDVTDDLAPGCERAQQRPCPLDRRLNRMDDGVDGGPIGALQQRQRGVERIAERVQRLDGSSRGGEAVDGGERPLHRVDDRAA